MDDGVVFGEFDDLEDSVEWVFGAGLISAGFFGPFVDEREGYAEVGCDGFGRGFAECLAQDIVAFHEMRMVDGGGKGKKELGWGDLIEGVGEVGVVVGVVVEVG